MSGFVSFIVFLCRVLCVFVFSFVCGLCRVLCPVVWKMFYEKHFRFDPYTKEVHPICWDNINKNLLCNSACVPVRSEQRFV